MASFPSPSQFGSNLGSFLSNNFSLGNVGKNLYSLGNFLTNALPKQYDITKDPNSSKYIAPAENKPLSVTGDPTTVPIINNSNAPVIPNNTSNLKATTASISANVLAAQEAQKKAQAAFDANQVAGKDVNGNPVATPTPAPGATTEPQNAFDKILALFQGGQKQINDLPKVPSLDETTNSILAKFGYTPESFKQVADLNTQLTSVNDQINELENQRQNEITALGQNGGATIGTAGAEENRINRAYAIREAGLGAKASVLTASISVLTKAYDQAESAAKDYVTFATAQQQQMVSDIKYSMDFYKDVYTAMDTSDQKRMNDLLDFQSKQLQLAATAAQNEINNELKKQGLDIQAMLAEAKLNGGGTGADSTSPGQIVVAANDKPVKLTDAQSTTFQRYDQYLNDLLPTAINLLDPKSPAKVSTGGAVGTIIERLQNVPIAQRTLTEPQNQLQTIISTMNNQLIYMLSGKQINESEYERLKKQLPDLTLTNEQNMTRINIFKTLLTQAKNSYLKLNGWKIKGEDNAGGSGSSAANDPLGIR